ncbi:glutamine--fructose-6-phosphate transaminase (isomerizing) [Candidatus Desulfovibrio trichonymphae]|uniref:Glutamine--fructose-6-phosphate aminotransferase [isomerizing] n=1 Tax=Candidatus Desulfovibrio trichonymphae TaxID=1725232 RepID=A0A1J1DVC1_9BACT|nr:glutamine--fructose-6-phosphate transaminase (isomerizing) [Candidatus Desulfovibrio trichonymphae]BAV91812.1 glutamine-fructose-6-phosphate transaminase [Candidatus Desulfovibrio trichonymphae]GHU97814.1 glutamine--fructose-6-phosphate aminotransferase [isomerizing] [Deltaproteobacteria bacterium]
MCGIIGYAGHRPAVPVVTEGLRRLEYRGYDSAGVAFMRQDDLRVIRSKGKLAALEEKLADEPVTTATCAIGHTRWATHGVPAERNAHPHCSNDGALAIVHNGIIENYQEIKADLTTKGYIFHSETDTEVLVNLIAERRKSEPDLLHALAGALREAHGAYAVCLIQRDAPGTFYAARMSAPLIFGLGTGENFVASDIPAFLLYTRRVIFLDDGDIVQATSTDYQIMHLADLQPAKHDPQTILWDMQAAQKTGFRHFMLKEIFEQPRVITDALTGRITTGRDTVLLPELKDLPIPKRLHIVACGTSYHSALWGRHLLEHWAHVPVQVEIASEFRYRDALLQTDDMMLVISQSGETADTLAALRIAREHGATVLGLCNMVGSSIAREASAVIYTQAGHEISVASTKAMCSQMLMLALLALYWSGRRNNAAALTKGQRRKWITILETLPALLDTHLPSMHEKARQLSRKYSQARNFFYLGRGHCFPLALEGALKLKELSYIHAEGYAAGEMKHGPIALVDALFPTFALAPDDALFPKVKSNITEVQARQGKIIALTNEGMELAADEIWIIPRVAAPLVGFMILPVLQLFSYEMSDYLGKDVDQPRNLAKSVTVE